MTWDDHDRQIKWSFPSKTATGTVSSSDYETYTYDLHGNRKTLRKRDGKTLGYDYDALHRVTKKTVPERIAADPTALTSTHTRDVSRRLRSSRGAADPCAVRQRFGRRA